MGAKVGGSMIEISRIWIVVRARRRTGNRGRASFYRPGLGARAQYEEGGLRWVQWPPDILDELCSAPCLEAPPFIPLP